MSKGVKRPDFGSKKDVKVIKNSKLKTNRF